MTDTAKLSPYDEAVIKARDHAAPVRMPEEAQCTIDGAGQPVCGWSDYSKLRAYAASLQQRLNLGECDECGTPYSYDATDGGSICVRCLKERLQRAASLERDAVLEDAQRFTETSLFTTGEAAGDSAASGAEAAGPCNIHAGSDADPSHCMRCGIELHPEVFTAAAPRRQDVSNPGGGVEREGKAKA